MKRPLVLLFLPLALAPFPPARAAEKILFADAMDAGNEGKAYTRVNADVTRLLDYGGSFLIQVLQPPFVPAPAAVLECNSGTYGKPTVLGVTATHRERYGQVFMEVGRPGPIASWLEIAVLGDKQLDSKGPNLIWDPHGKFRRLTPREEILTPIEYPTNRLHAVTLNYDLEDLRYEVWLDGEKIIEDAPFASPEFAGGASGLALSATYWGEGKGSWLREWRWRCGDQPFK